MVTYVLHMMESKLTTCYNRSWGGRTSSIKDFDFCPPLQAHKIPFVFMILIIYDQSISMLYGMLAFLGWTPASGLECSEWSSKCIHSPHYTCMKQFYQILFWHWWRNLRIKTVQSAAFSWADQIWSVLCQGFMASKLWPSLKDLYKIENFRKSFKHFIS